MRDIPDVAAGLSRSYLFEGLSLEQLTPLAEGARVRSLVRGESLWQVGDPANEIYVVRTGEVKSYIVDADGDEVLELLHGPGMTFGEPGYFAVERNRVVGGMAVTASVVIRLDRRDLDPFMVQYPQIKDRALEGLAAVARWYGAVVMVLQRRPLRERILHKLLDLAHPVPGSTDGTAITTPISQSTLASMTGVSRENVNRALAGLMSDGTIRRDGSRYVLADVALLQAELSYHRPVLPPDRRR
jgi:CRP/FNR family cyclic AMP-dependent transcriptional regulator